MVTKAEITEMLKDIEDGKKSAYHKLLPLVYDELKKIAKIQLHAEYHEHTISKTELVHEAFVKLVDQTAIRFNDRKHFYSIAARAMRQFLIDYARKKKAEKRGGGQHVLTFNEEYINFQEELSRLPELYEYLDELQQLDARLALVVEFRFYVGLNMKEIADILGFSEITIKRDWAKAKAWLYMRFMQENKHLLEKHNV